MPCFRRRQPPQAYAASWYSRVGIRQAISDESSYHQPPPPQEPHEPHQLPELLLPELVLPELVPELVVPELVVPELVVPELVVPELVLPVLVLPEVVEPPVESELGSTLANTETACTSRRRVIVEVITLELLKNRKNQPFVAGFAATLTVTVGLV